MIEPTEESAIFNHGFGMIGAIDEAGRGPLAGPVVAACVICPRGFDFSREGLSEINDSKQLSYKKRAELSAQILAIFPEVGVGLSDHLTIDRVNILEAAYLAMKKAVGALKTKPDFVLVDGRFVIPNFSIKQKAIISGDKLVLTIAAASIVAKVRRDRIMEEMHELYPQYGFDRHKGYGTKLHMDKLKEYGPCPIHRRSFAPVRDVSC
jgi:ribonuclease HII